MVVEELYYGEGRHGNTTPHQRGQTATWRASGESAGIGIDEDVLATALREIYRHGETVLRSDVEAHLFREIARIFTGAANKGAGPTLGGDPMLDALRHSGDVFAAFKVHRAQSDMAARLLDSNGNLKPFEQWKNEVLPIASHQCGAWLETEYDTAVLRARQAAQWQQFEREKDVLPNLRWVTSTSPHPGADHRPFWNTVLPIGHPFWNQHRPGDRWNCKCDLTNTDEPTTGVPTTDGNSNPQAGLKDNPGQSGALIGDDHPYFPKDCRSCPFYKPGFNARLRALFMGQVKDCYHCPYVDGCVDRAKEKDEGANTRHTEPYKPEIYGERLQVSPYADATELTENIRAAEALLESFKDVKIKIREHVIAHGVPNPEYEINGLIADRKGIKSSKGISSGFRKAIKQGCEAVVIDLDMHLKERPLDCDGLARHLDWRKEDFISGIIKKCYIIYHGKAVRIDVRHVGRDAIMRELEKLKQ